MKKIVILGAGESGTGSAILAKDKGFDVFVSDMSQIKPAYKEILDREGIAWEEGHHSEDRILDADEVIKSPGIPPTAPMIQKIMQKHIPVISEIEFAYRYTDAKMVCITGSNGKTTTTSLIYYILKNANMNVGLAGNIGRSFALQVARERHDIYVLELSSFQLDNMYDFKADVAVLLNITPDHLDRYDYKLENYAASKMRIVQNQTKQDAFIYWSDDPIIASFLQDEKRDIQASTYPFNDQTPITGSLTKSQLSLKGRHNLYNSLAAGIAAQIVGVSDDIIGDALQHFSGVEHRLQKVGEINGVEFINDSKATNVDACYYALESVTRPTILILGGLDKGNDYSQIYNLVKEKCIGLVYLGADNTKLHDTFDDTGLPIADVNNMKDCIKECWKMSRPGACILLSPCCASFDLFKNMEDRGEQFVQGMHELMIK